MQPPSRHVISIELLGEEATAIASSARPPLNQTSQRQMSLLRVVLLILYEEDIVLESLG